MRAFAGVGFSDLEAEQGEITKMVPGVNARIAKALDSVRHESLPLGIVIYSYFEQRPTGRTPVHMRLQPNNELLIRLDVVVPQKGASAEDMLEHYLEVWAVMLQRLSRYFARRGVPVLMAQQVVHALCLPAA